MDLRLNLLKLKRHIAAHAHRCQAADGIGSRLLSALSTAILDSMEPSELASSFMTSPDFLNHAAVAASG